MLKIFLSDVIPAYFPLPGWERIKVRVIPGIITSLVLFLLIQASSSVFAGTYSVYSATAQINEVTNITSLLDDFSRGVGPDNWGGRYLLFATTGTAVITSGYDSANAYGSTGYAYQINFNAPSSGDFCGVEAMLTNGSSGRDISGYKYLSFMVKTTVTGAFSFKVEMKNGSSDAARKSSFIYVTDYIDGGVNSTWKEAKLPLDAFANLDSLTNVKSIVFVFEHDYEQTNGISTNGTIYIDDIQFGAVAMTTLRVDHFSDNWGVDALGGNTGDMPDLDHSSHTFVNTYYKPYARSLKSNYNVSDSGWGGMFFIFGGGTDQWTAEPHDYSAYSKITLWIVASSSSRRPAKIKLELIDNVGSSAHTATIPDDTEELTAIPNMPPVTNWVKYTINFNKFVVLSGGEAGTVVDPHSIKQMNIIYDSVVGANKIGSLYIDSIQFEQ